MHPLCLSVCCRPTPFQPPDHEQLGIQRYTGCRGGTPMTECCVAMLKSDCHPVVLDCHPFDFKHSSRLRQLECLLGVWIEIHDLNPEMHTLSESR